MNMTRDRLASIGWMSILAVVAALAAALMLRVNAVKSQVQLAERQIIELRHEKEFLETEYETRANQQQLTDLNDLDFGYKAPAAGQYLESERQLASLGKPRAADAPAPILMASADDGTGRSGSIIPAMVSPIAGKLVSEAQAAEPDGDVIGKAITSATLGDRLSHVRRRAGDDAAMPARKAARLAAGDARE
ncbi:MAG: hypothetical protein KGN34_15260 [Sphingomonadales bacterium]|nr:hypothetical protein [Sphingomonadales bacterium]